MPTANAAQFVDGFVAEAEFKAERISWLATLVMAHLTGTKDGLGMRRRRNWDMDLRDRERILPSWDELTPAEQWEARLAPFTLLVFCGLLYLLFGGE
jgi:hypothetical protein